MSQVCRACSFSRSPTNPAKSRVIGPMEKAKARVCCSSVTATQTRSTKACVGDARASVAWAFGRLGVPDVPNGLRRTTRRGFAPSDGVIEPTLEDDGARAEVGQHVSDGPLRREGLLFEFARVETLDDPAQPPDGCLQYGDSVRHFLSFARVLMARLAIDAGDVRPEMEGTG